MDEMPHTKEWFEALRRINAQQAAMTEHIVKLAGRDDVCSICGDTESASYRVVAEPSFALRPCDDRKRIQKDMYGSSFDRMS